MIIFDAIVLEQEHLSPILASVVMIGPTIFYLPVGLYVCFGLLHSLRHSTQWLNIVHKVAESNGITEQSAPGSYDTTIIGLRFHPEAIAAWTQIKPSSIKRRQALILLGPVLLQILLFAPHMVDSWTILEAKKNCASAVIQQLDETFSQSFLNTSYDDPHEDYQRAGYHYIARLPKTENFENIHITVTVSNSEKIEDISYWCDVNVNLSKEENMAAAKQGIEKLHEVLLAANPPLYQRNKQKFSTSRMNSEQRFAKVLTTRRSAWMRLSTRTPM